jgi:hypothetical protein
MLSDVGKPEQTEGHPAIRHFQFGRHVTYNYRVMNAAIDPVYGLPHLQTMMRLFRGNTAVLRTEPRPLPGSAASDFRRILVGGTLQLRGTLQPGDYTLQIVVTDKLAKPGRDTVAQWIDFDLVASAQSN